MVRLNKTLVLTAAVIATGLVAVMDMAQSRTEPTAAATVAARFPTQAEMLTAFTHPGAAKGDRASCTREHWPYIADECLTRPEGQKQRPPVRTITIERRIATNASRLAS